MTSSSSTPPGWTERIYRRLLHVYPRDFRRRFGPEMTELFRTRRLAAARRGLRASLGFWWATLADFTRTAASARRPVVRRARGKRPEAAAAIRDAVREAARFLRHAPGVSMTVILLLALTIGAAISIFSIVHAALLRPLPYPEPDGLVAIWEAREDRPGERLSVSGHEFPVWQERARAFDSLAAVLLSQGTLTGSGSPTVLSGARVTASFFDVFAVAPVLGRGFSADEDRPGQGNVIVLSHHVWRDRFGADRGVIGRSILLDGRQVTVVGVMGAAFEFPRTMLGGPPDYWMPIAEPIYRYRGRHYLQVVGRLATGTTLAAAQADLDRVVRELAAELPELNRGHEAQVVLLHADLVRHAKPVLWLLLAAVCCLVAIGCANIAGLFVARGLARRQEIAVRLALGASRWRIARQLVAESLLLALAGGVAGLAAATLLARSAPALIPDSLLALEAVPLDPSIVVFALVVTLVTAGVFSLGPVLQVGRVELNTAMKSAGRALATAGPPRLRRVLVIAQVAITVVLVLSAALLGRSLDALRQIDVGFSTRDVLAMDVSLPSSRYPDAARQREFATTLLAQVAQLPGVRDVALTNAAPLGPARSTIAVDVEGYIPRAGDESSASYRVVSAGYFRTLGIPVRAGREFAPADARRAVPLIRWFPQQPVPPLADAAQPPPVAVINEAMAARYWPARDPIGQRFRVLLSPPVTVVGVVASTRSVALTEPAVPEFYLHDLQEPQTALSVLTRGETPSAPSAGAVQAAIWSLDPELAISSARTLADMADHFLLVPRFTSILVGTFAASALVLMAVGLYGLMAMTTAMRLPELSVRLALGAGRGDVIALLVRHGLLLAVAGAAAGGVAVLPLMDVLQSQLPGIAATDPLTWAAAGLVVLVTAGLASWWPARRAARLDLTGVLRREGA